MSILRVQFHLGGYGGILHAQMITVTINQPSLVNR